MSSSVSKQLSVKAKLELLLLLDFDEANEIIDYAPVNSKWKYAGSLVPSFFGHFGPEPLGDVTNEALSLAVDNAELSVFVEHLFLGDEPLYIPGVTPSAELIPAVVQAFKDSKPSVRQLRFRPLQLCFIHAPHNKYLHELWPDAADHRIQPCPFCSPCMVDGTVIDRYHFVKDTDGQRLTVELSWHWFDARIDGCPDTRGYTRSRQSVTAVRIFAERDAKCSRSLPTGPERQLEFLKQAEILEEVFRFAVRDDLDTFQLACRHFCMFVDGRAGALALRSLQEVSLSRQCKTAEWFARVDQAPSVTGVPGRLFVGSGSKTSMERVLSLLRNGCAMRLIYVPNPASVLQSLISEEVRFAVRLGELRCFRASPEGMDGSLQLMRTLGVKQFHFWMPAVRYVRLLASEALAGATFCQIFTDAVDQPTLTEIQQLADDFLRNGPGKRLSFMMPPFCPVVRADRIIERFLEAEKPGELGMLFSVQLEFRREGIPAPAQCRYPTLRNVIIPPHVLARHRKESASRFDVYHFRNARTKEHLTVCLGIRDDRSVGFIFIENGCIFESEEDIANMKPFPYELVD